MAKDENDTIRVIAVAREEAGVEWKIREDLMSDGFPSVWLEVQDREKSGTIIGGFYRQWSNKGERST